MDYNNLTIKELAENYEKKLKEVYEKKELNEISYNLAVERIELYLKEYDEYEKIKKMVSPTANNYELQIKNLEKLMDLTKEELIDVIKTFNKHLN